MTQYINVGGRGMYKIRIMDINQDHIHERKKLKVLKINDTLFGIGVRKGLIEKNEDGDYYFTGDYGELLAFKSEKPSKKFKLLD